MTTSSFFSHCYSIGVGISGAHYANYIFESEATVRQGRNHNMVASLQSSQINMALNQGLILCRLQGIEISSSILLAKQIIALSPYAIAYIANRSDLSLRTRRIINLFQDHIGKITLAITLISTASFFMFGYALASATTVIYLGIGVLDRKGYLPNNIRNIISQTGFFVTNITSLFNSDSLTKFFATIDLVSTVVNYYFDFKIKKLKQAGQFVERSLTHPPIPPTPVPPLLLSDIDKLKLKVNKCHVHNPLLPPIKKGVDINELLEFNKKVDWSKHQHVLNRKLATDARWTQVGILESNTPQEYFNKCLKNFVTSLKDHKILVGQPDSYEKLEKYCLFITQELRNKDEITIVDTLLEMGIGGDYCGTDYFRIIEERVSLLLNHVEGLPLDLRFLICLQNYRIEIWHLFYTFLWSSNFWINLHSQFTDKNDIHNHNLMLKILGVGKEWGLPQEGAENDRVSHLTPSTEYLTSLLSASYRHAFWNKSKPVKTTTIEVNKTLPPPEKWKFWKTYHVRKEMINLPAYTTDSIVDLLTNEIGKKNSIPKILVYEWWEKWIQRQNLSDEEKESSVSDLYQKAFLNGVPMELDGKINKKFLKAMLLEMGILTLES